MKLNEMKSRQAMDTLADLAPIIGRIMDDEELIMAVDTLLKDYFVKPKENDTKKAKSTENQSKKSLKKLLSTVLYTLVPKVLKEHQNDLYAFTSILSGKSVTDLENMTLIPFINELMGVLNADVFSFFTSAEPMTQPELSE